MRDRTAFAVLGMTLLAVIAVGLFLFRSRSASAATPASLFTTPPPLPSAVTSASAPLPPLVIRPVVHPVAPKSSGKTLERLAADAFHAGDRKRAAALYSELAARTPENPSFAKAAAMLDRR